MPFNQTFLPGVDTRMEVDPVTWQYRQDPTSLNPNAVSAGSLLQGSNLVVLRSTGTASQTIFDANAPALTVLDVWIVMTADGGVGDTVKVTDGTTDITDTIDCTAASNKERIGCGMIDDAVQAIAAEGSLVVTRASSCPCDVYILAVLT